MIPAGPAARRRLVRELGGPAALLALDLALFGGVLLRGEGALLGNPHADLLMQYLPWRVFGFGELARGNLPLWNPHIFSGRPFLADFQSALFYPPNLLHLLLPPRLAINVTLLLHLWLAGAFTWAWARWRGLGRPAASLAGLVAMLGGPFLLHVEAGHLTHVCSVPWTPLVFLGLEGAVAGRARGVRLRWLLLGSAAAALQVLAGHPQFAYNAALASGLLALAHALVPLPAAATGPERRGLRSRLWPLMAWAGVWAGAGALAAAQVLPGLEVALESGRWEQTGRDFAASFSLPLENLLTVVAPHVHGGLGLPYYGRWYAWEVTPFVGCAALVLAFLAPGTRARADAAVVAVLLLLALGSEVPFFGALYELVPGYRLFRVPARQAVPALFLLALLAAQGLERLRRQGVPRAAPWLVGAGALALTLLAWARVEGAVPWPAILATMESAPVRQFPAGILTRPGVAERAATLAGRELLVAAGACLLLASLLALGRRRPALASALPLVALLELGAFGLAHRQVSPPALPYPEAWRRVTAAAGEIRVRHATEAYANQGMLLGHLDAWGYDANPLARYAALMAEAERVAGREGDLSPRLRGVLAMLRWRYLLGRGPDGAPAALDLGEALPRALLVPGFVLAGDRAGALRTLFDPGFDPRRVVVLESEPVPRPAAPPAGSPARVHVVERSTDELEVEVETGAPALLLVTDAYARGWRARALGPAPQASYAVLPANHALRAVPLAAGRHRLVLEYSPAGFRRGRLVSALALAAWAAGLWLTRKAPRAAAA